MVRVGGGWDTLEHYLDKHDPCRCSSSSKCLLRVWAASRKGLVPEVLPLTLLYPFPQPTGCPSREPGLSLRRGDHPLLVPALVAQSLEVSAGAPGPK